jgi:hypothetical protein
MHCTTGLGQLKHLGPLDRVHLLSIAVVKGGELACHASIMLRSTGITCVGFLMAC